MNQDHYADIAPTGASPFRYANFARSYLKETLRYVRLASHRELADALAPEAVAAIEGLKAPIERAIDLVEKAIDSYPPSSRWRIPRD